MSEPNEQKAVIKTPVGGWDWHGAFMAYCEGHTVQEIGQVFNIPEDKIIRQMTRYRWDASKDKLLSMTNTPFHKGAPVLAKLELLAANRQRIYEKVSTLIEDAGKVITALNNGTLKLKKQWKMKGVGREAPDEIVEKEVDPSIQDRVAIATYLKLLADISYRALGDVAPGESQNVPSAASSIPQAITIILPAAIAQPRHLRGRQSEATPLPNSQPIIEIEPSKPQEEQEKNEDTKP
jgi:hypothetical protein